MIRIWGQGKVGNLGLCDYWSVKTKTYELKSKIRRKQIEKQNMRVDFRSI